MDKVTLLRHILAEMPKNPPSRPNAVLVIEMLVFTRVQMLDVTGPLQVFASANDLVAETAAEEGKAPPYELRVVAQGGAAVAASAGLELIANPLPPPGTALDTLIVPAARVLKRRLRTRFWSNGCGNWRSRPGALRLSARERSCWPPRVS
jgi:hypothetical protein